MIDANKNQIKIVRSYDNRDNQMAAGRLSLERERLLVSRQ